MTGNVTRLTASLIVFMSSSFGLMQQIEITKSYHCVISPCDVKAGGAVFFLLKIKKPD
jgi:hypothetical protein